MIPRIIRTPCGTVTSAMPDDLSPRLNFRTYNTQYGRGFYLPLEIWVVQMLNYDMILLMETKIIDEVYCNNRIEYDGVCSRATPTVVLGAQGRVGMVTMEISEIRDIKSMQFCGPNLVCFKIVSGIQRIPLIGAYLPMTTLCHLPNLGEALNFFPGRYPIVLRDLNADVFWMGNSQDKQAAKFMVYLGPVELFDHFGQWLRPQHTKTWFQARQVKLLRFCCDYILGSNRRLFKIMGIRYMRNFSSENFALHTWLICQPTLLHSRYL